MLENLDNASYDDEADYDCSCYAGYVQKTSERQHFAEKSYKECECEPPSRGSDKDTTNDQKPFQACLMDADEREGSHEDEEGQRVGYGEEECRDEILPEAADFSWTALTLLNAHLQVGL